MMHEVPICLSALHRTTLSLRVGAGVGGSESTVNVTQLRVRVLMYLSRARATELSRLDAVDGIPTPRPLPSV